MLTEYQVSINVRSAKDICSAINHHWCASVGCQGPGVMAPLQDLLWGNAPSWVAGGIMLGGAGACCQITPNSPWGEGGGYLWELGSPKPVLLLSF